MNIGRRIYYDKMTGNVIQDTGERSGDVVETTTEQDFSAYDSLTKYDRTTVGYLQLEYGDYALDFAACNGYKVDVSKDTISLVFYYPDPQVPEVSYVFNKLLSK